MDWSNISLSLKISFTCQSDNEQTWVLLGIRTTPKEELGCSSAEIVYGALLSVSGESGLGTNKKYDLNLQQLYEQISSLKPIPTSWHGSTRSHTPRNCKQPSLYSSAGMITTLHFNAFMRPPSNFLSHVRRLLKWTEEEEAIQYQLIDLNLQTLTQKLNSHYQLQNQDSNLLRGTLLLKHLHHHHNQLSPIQIGRSGQLNGTFRF